MNNGSVGISTSVVVMTTTYIVIFITGILGNVGTCLVISRNKSMQTSTNYYLFSLSISDMVLLITGLPSEIYNLWFPEMFLFGNAVCILRGFLSEGASNATVLTIAAFTIERYIAICHPFQSHKSSTSSRARRYILFIWLVSLGLAVPQASQFGTKTNEVAGTEICTVVRQFFRHAFEISTFLFFVGPMILITVLYVLIAVELRRNKDIINRTADGGDGRVVRMLVAVVVAFFLCWAPFHCQRLLAVYLLSPKVKIHKNHIIVQVYTVLTYSSGILYYLSTTINPILYHIMSNKFRIAFKKTIVEMCSSKRQMERHGTCSLLNKFIHPSVSLRDESK